MKRYLLLFFFLLFIQHGFAQTDTAFWFAAPDISSVSSFDRPIYLRLTSYQNPCVVKISIPANPAFPVQTVNIAPNSTQTVDLTPWISMIECSGANAVENKGLKILSDNRLSAYYEVNAGGPNQDFFVLKGSSALGNEFFISSQNVVSNSSAYTPPPMSSFNIVATEDNTSITVTLRNAIVGHAANTTFSVILNKGQTYAGISVSQSASSHLEGTYITSTKPVSVTLADDLLATSCGQDLAGDQTIPVNILGTEYIVVKADLTSVSERVFVTATQNGTVVKRAGVNVATINRGETADVTLNNSAEYIQTTFPSYVYQLTGSGCELSSALIPKLLCTGSSSVSFVKTISEPVKVLLLVKNGGQGNFFVNGAAGVINSTDFTVVPATGGQWYSAKVTLSSSAYPINTVITVTNTTILFQLGYLQVTALGTGYGYFSDFNTLSAQASASNSNPCAGSTVNLYAETIASATYSWQGPGSYTSANQNPVLTNISAAESGNYIVDINVPGCGIYKDTVVINVLQPATNIVNQAICQGQSYLGYTSTGTYTDHFTAANGCDSARTLNLTVKPQSFTTNNQVICDGQTYQGHTVTGTYVSTLVAANGCDSIYTLNLTVKPRSFTTNNQTICEGQSYEGHTTTGTYVSTLVAANGCDSIYTLNLTVKPRSLSTINMAICDGQSYAGHTTSGTYTDTYVAANGCDSVRTLNLTVKPRSLTTNNQVICDGQTYQGHTVTGTYVSTLVAANGCDSIYTLNLTVKPRSFTTNNQSVCDGQSYEGHTTSGTFVTTLTAANGCDSIYTLNLIVKPRSFTTNNQSICEGQSYQGHTTSGTYVSTLVAANGCDSIYTLNLTVKPRSLTTINAAICEGQTYAGHSTAGTYTDTYVAANGCDSIRTLNLTVKPRSFTTLTQTICEGQVFQGHNTAGTYITTLTGANGCDSIYTLVLLVKPKSSATVNKTICEGGVFEGYSVSGSYQDIFVGANGCDSVRTLNLTVLPLPKPYLGKDTSVCRLESFMLSPGIFDSYLWQDGSQLSYYTVSMPGTYSVTVTNTCGSASDIIIVGEKSCNFYFPNVFSPNSDSKNDHFRIVNPAGISDYSLAIFNRWGEKVFETNEIAKGWDGNYKNHPAPEGSYVWYAQLKKEGRSIKVSGSVILLR